MVGALVSLFLMREKEQMPCEGDECDRSWTLDASWRRRPGLLPSREMDAVRYGTITERSLWAARLAVLGIFFLSGFGFASWAVRIPAVQGRLDLGEGLLGVALLGMAAGSLVSMPLAGWLVSRLGSRPVVGATALAYSLVLPLLAVSPSLALLVPALALVGAATGPKRAMSRSPRSRPATMVAEKAANPAAARPGPVPSGPLR